MDMGLTLEQKQLIRGLKLFGCSLIETMAIVAELWHLDDVDEMLDYMFQHRDATPAQLYEVCCQISSRRGPMEEPEEEEE